MIKVILIAFIYFLLFSPVTAAGNGSLLFNQVSKSLTSGKTNDVTISIDPDGGNTIGVDMVFLYDPIYIEIVNIENLGLLSGETGKVIDNNNGIARYSLSNPYGKYHTTKGNIAKLVIKGKKPVDRTIISFDFISGKTFETNIAVPNGEDILTRVNIINLKIDGNSDITPDNPTTTPSPSGISTGTFTGLTTSKPSNITSGITSNIAASSPLPVKLNKGEVLGDTTVKNTDLSQVIPRNNPISSILFVIISILLLIFCLTFMAFYRIGKAQLSKII